jgi:hypothetical protein
MQSCWTDSILDRARDRREEEETLTTHETKVRPPQKPLTDEAKAMRRIGRILDNLDELPRTKVVGALVSLYYGPVPK